MVEKLRREHGDSTREYRPRRRRGKDPKFAAAVTKMAGAKNCSALKKSTNGTNASSAAIVLTEDEKIELNSWNFKVFEYEEEKNRNSGVAQPNAQRFLSSSYEKAFSFVVEMFGNSVFSPSSSMNPSCAYSSTKLRNVPLNPYHNFTRKLDRAHHFRYIKLTKSRTKITSSNVSPSIAAIIHDVDIQVRVSRS